MVVIVLFVLTANLLLDRPVIESLLFAGALAVGLSPELLPTIISVTLSAGGRAMAKRGVIVPSAAKSEVTPFTSSFNATPAPHRSTA